eukprot:scaffold27230_cov26-Tisochrysis_lutea.AAC.4
MAAGGVSFQWQLWILLPQQGNSWAGGSGMSCRPDVAQKPCRVVLKNTGWFYYPTVQAENLSALATDAAGELDVLGHD